MLLTLHSTVISTPIGSLEILSTEHGIMQIHFTDLHPTEPQENDACAAQLCEYFEGKRTAFTSLSLRYASTDFQRDVWETLLTVPCGETVTYAELAKEAGHPGAARAVGTAMRLNPLCIVIPCHRVVPEGGGFGEYAGEAWRKEWLLNHERNLCV